MKNSTELKVLDFTFIISVLKSEEIPSPWNPEMGRVHKYMLSVTNADNEEELQFEYHTSIADCKSKERDLAKRLTEYFECGGDAAKRTRLLGNLRAIASGNDGDTNIMLAPTFATLKALRIEMRQFRGSFGNFGKSPFLETKAFAQTIADEVFKKNTLNVAALFPGGLEPKMIDEQGLKQAFYCIVSDAISGTYDIDEFQSEFGYTKVSECLKVHRACQRLLRDLGHIGVDEAKLYDLINAMQEIGLG